MHGWGRTGLVALLALGGCNSTSIPVDLDGSAASIKRSIDRGYAIYDMTDGEAVNVSDPRDFGWAICGGNACVRKAEIRGVHFRETSHSLSPEKLLLAPAIIVGLGLIQPTAGGGGPTSARTVADDLPECVEHRDPAPPASALASQEALTEWVWSNQKSVNAGCLRRMVAQLASSDMARAVRLNMLASAKHEWNRARCNNWRGAYFKLVPLYGNKGPVDPRWLDWIDEIIADPETFGPGLEDGACAAFGGVAPESEWESRKPALHWELSPFNRGPYPGPEGVTGFGDPPAHSQQ
ncbi:MAG: hypothetical protein R3C46_00385 [Hyphomonadaceae bacterium]